MRWSTRIMIPGVLIMALGALPLALGHFGIVTLEFSAALITVGLFIFLIGWGLRKLRKSFESMTQQKETQPS